MKKLVLIFLTIFIATLLIFILPHIFDYLNRGDLRISFMEPIITVDPETARSFLGSVAEVNTGIFGIIITVVAIIVQLSANRYTSKIIDLFIKNRVNVFFLGLFAVICVSGIWVTNSVQDNYLPRVGILTYLGLTSFGFFVLVPYFYYVFEFLKPQNIIHRIEKQSNQYLEKVIKHDTGYDALQDNIVENIERLSDIAMNSLVSLDRSLGLNCIHSLQSMTMDYLSKREKFQQEWFEVPRRHFLGFDPDVIQEIDINEYWVEMKIMRQLESLLIHSLEKDQQISNAVCISTKAIATQAFYLRQRQILELVIGYFNNFLRFSIEKDKGHATTNILHQYRLLAEEILIAEGIPKEDSDLVVQIAEYFKYYGQFAASQGLSELLETAAYDLRVLNEHAFHRGSESQRRLLSIFLTVDNFPESARQEKALRGVRKSQAILASFYLLYKREDLAQEIYNDMKTEPVNRLKSIKEEILNLETERFWEVTERWVSFDYINQNRKEKLREFFGWFGIDV